MTDPSQSMTVQWAALGVAMEYVGKDQKGCSLIRTTMYSNSKAYITVTDERGSSNEVAGSAAGNTDEFYVYTKWTHVYVANK